MGKKLTLENSPGSSKTPADGLERGGASRGRGGVGGQCFLRGQHLDPGCVALPKPVP